MRRLRTWVLPLCPLHPQVRRGVMLISLLSASAPLTTVNLLPTKAPDATVTQNAAMPNDLPTGIYWLKALVYDGTIIELINSSSYMT